ncbi:AAA-domain-containing protein [Gonapodya prolifera JEL478]|uniref:AAA-domain-containing protein n=1 Tax=Gonapodya prolifera (strain JEL478) TaxID=1344416 RepID=A0A139B0R9_GONPJ|nr:AAA-domain-containing protein [Gonapodya prolifera JEL478]|eukprot:KXS22574.1 AAA-domain-containing protein [Gonapodya prolifera JEL478]
MSSSCVLRLLNDASLASASGAVTIPTGHISKEDILRLALFTTSDPLGCTNSENLSTQKGFTDVKSSLSTLNPDATVLARTWGLLLKVPVFSQDDGKQGFMKPQLFIRGRENSNWSRKLALFNDQSREGHEEGTYEHMLLELKLLPEMIGSNSAKARSAAGKARESRDDAVEVLFSKEDMRALKFKPELKLSCLLIPFARLHRVSRITVSPQNPPPAHPLLPSWPFFPFTPRRIREVLVGKVVARGLAVKIHECDVRKAKQRSWGTTSFKRELSMGSDLWTFNVSEVCCDTSDRSSPDEKPLFALVTNNTIVELQAPDATPLNGESLQISIDDDSLDAKVSAVGTYDGGERFFHLIRLAHLQSSAHLFARRISVPAPTTILLSGPPGSGKSRLLHVASQARGVRLETITAGSVFAAGQAGFVGPRIVAAVRRAIEVHSVREPGRTPASLIVVALDHVELLVGSRAEAVATTADPFEGDEDAVDGFLEAAILVSRSHERRNEALGAESSDIGPRALLVGLTSTDPGKLPARALEVFSQSVALGPPPTHQSPESLRSLTDEPAAAFAGRKVPVHPTLEPLVRSLKASPILANFRMAPPLGAMFYGSSVPTTLSDDLASALDWRCAKVRLTDLVKGEVGAGERAVREIFGRCEREGGGWIVSMEGVDAVIRSNTMGGQGVGDKVLTQLLVELDRLALKGMRPKTRTSSAGRATLFVVLSTDRPWDIDPRLLRAGRIDRHVYVRPPTNEQLHALLASSFPPLSPATPPPTRSPSSPLPAHPDVTAALPSIVEHMSGRNEGDVRELVRRARAGAVQRVVAKARRGGGGGGVRVGDGDGGAKEFSGGELLKAALEAAMVEVEDVEAAMRSLGDVERVVEEERYKNWTLFKRRVQQE